MRITVLVLGVFILTGPTVAYGQPCMPQTVAYDPYNPSDAAIVRQFGGAVMAQAPLSTLLQLDPYVPSHGELLRQVGNGIPLWLSYGWYPAPAIAGTRPPDCTTAPSGVAEPEHTPAAPLTSFAELMSILQTQRAATPARASLSARSTAGERNRGVTITFAGRTWVSAGAAVPFQEAAFTRAGDSNGFTVYRRAGAKDNIVFVPTMPGMVAPFRAAPAK